MCASEIALSRALVHYCKQGTLIMKQALPSNTVSCPASADAPTAAMLLSHHHSHDNRHRAGTIVPSTDPDASESRNMAQDSNGKFLST